MALATLGNVIVPDWPIDMLSNDESVQGVVLHYTAVGRNNPVANEDGMTENNMGRAAVHEVETADAGEKCTWPRGGVFVEPRIG